MSVLSTEYRPIVLPPGKTFTDLSTEQKLRVVFGHLDRLRQSNGGYLSAPAGCGPETQLDRYEVFALRDLFLASTANEYLGEAERLLATYALVLQILEKFHHRIIDVITEWPAEEDYARKLLPNRYHPLSLAEVQDGHNGHQAFMLGMLLYKFGDMMKHGFNLIVRPAEIHLLKDLVQYAHNSRWTTDPDQGFWDDELALRSSTLGAMIGGLSMWQPGGYYDFRYPANRDITRLVPIPNRPVEAGRAAMMELLPRETEDREVDLAQLSLLWPFNVLRGDKELQDQILAQVEGLVGERGVKRYAGDPFEAGDDGQEAEWPLGLAWLAVVLAKIVYRELEAGTKPKQLMGLLEKAEEYMGHLNGLTSDDGRIPMLYRGSEPSTVAPYATAHGMYVSAVISIRQSRHELEQRLRR